MYFEDSKKIVYVTSLSAISGFMLYNIRGAMGLSQADMGKLFNISHATYRSIEQGETAINVDFIFMLCSIIECKFSDYFMLVEDIAIFLMGIEKDMVNTECEVKLIPNGDFQKIVNDALPENSFGNINTNAPKILYDQDFNLFYSPEIRKRILGLVDKFMMKDDFKKIVKITSDEVGEVVDALKTAKLDNVGFVSANTLPIGASASAVALYSSILNPFTLPVVTGLALYKAYKKSKEDRKSKN